MNIKDKLILTEIIQHNNNSRLYNVNTSNQR